MRQNDARQLSHDMLEDMRRRAVTAVQEGQSLKLSARHSVSTARRFTIGWRSIVEAAGVL
jgi:hypothetical protein